MNFFDVFSEMLVILFCMAAGFLAHKLGYLGGETDQRLCRLILGITMPCLILGSVSAGDTLPSAGEVLSILKVAAVFYGLGFLAAAFVPRLLGGTAKQQGVWRYCLVFANMAFIGYPVSVALFGQDALFYAVILVLPFNLLSFSLGPLMLAGQAKFRWQQLTSPCVIAAVAALVDDIAVILMATPAALNGSMLAMEYGGDTECMAQSIFLTTLMSILTIPVLAALL